ncbi:hypothetical protein, partial [Paenibacillus sp. JJ-223]|uniref:hypothetical protein n=1 Tax=Paenibacillus sp. JJ-223 TaxID=2905647 RepID=UPI001F23AEBD
METSSHEYIFKDPSISQHHLYKTDFEYITYTNEEVGERCFWLNDEDIIYIRFVYSPDIDRFFPKFKFQECELNKFFLLPTHKTKEFKHTLNLEDESKE